MIELLWISARLIDILYVKLVFRKVPFPNTARL